MDIRDEVIAYIQAHRQRRLLSKLARETGLDRSWFDKIVRDGHDMRLGTAERLLAHKRETGLPDDQAAA